jgi:hypothetical protein
MTREIKFRGISNGNWVFGYLVSTPNNNYPFAIKNTSYNFNNGRMNLIPCEIQNPETIGQFTGLRDRNGVDIYEGDLVQHEAWDYPFEVIFNQEKARFSCKMKTGLTQHIDNKQLTVVGNIYECTTATPTGEDVGE